MGVIKTVSNLNDSYPDSIEDVLNEIEEQIQNFEVETRRIRKIKHRSNTSRPRAIGGIHNTTKKSGKRKNRYENSNYLLTLADPDEAAELSIHDFISPTISVFSQMLLNSDSIEIWHEFVNCTDQENWFQNVITQQNPSIPSDNESSSLAIEDLRTDHPAFSPAECFRKIDSDLRCVLRKRHVPMGALIYLERELVTFFINRPQSIYHSHIPNSFERLLLHALCQYMDLSALSYDRCGARWTRVYNKHSVFQHPVVLLSTFLEQRMQKSSRHHN